MNTPLALHLGIRRDQLEAFSERLELFGFDQVSLSGAEHGGQGWNRFVWDQSPADDSILHVTIGLEDDGQAQFLAEGLVRVFDHRGHSAASLDGTGQVALLLTPSGANVPRGVGQVWTRPEGPDGPVVQTELEQWVAASPDYRPSTSRFREAITNAHAARARLTLLGQWDEAEVESWQEYLEPGGARYGDRYATELYVTSLVTTARNAPDPLLEVYTATAQPLVVGQPARGTAVLTYASGVQLSPWAGVYQGIQEPDPDDPWIDPDTGETSPAEPIHLFTGGHVNGVPQTSHGFPVSQLRELPVAPLALDGPGLAGPSPSGMTL